MNQWLSRHRLLLVLSLMFSGLLIITGCAGPSVQKYEGQKPSLDLAQYFSGKTTGWGMVTNRSGEITRRFVVHIEGRFDGNSGELDEHFDWSDGEKQRRVWKLEKIGPRQWKGRADDVIGEAQGEIAGNTLRWRYTLAVPIDGRTIHLDFDDWMVLVDEKVLLNKAQFSKFGLYLGEVTLAFQRP